VIHLRLAIQPLPNSTWGISLSQKLDKETWDYLRRECYKGANYRCEICFSDMGGLNAHELWKFDDKKLLQIFNGLECVCTSCHEVHHFGRSSLVFNLPQIEELIRHWCRVNRMTFKDFQKHKAEVDMISMRRANKKYTVMIGKRVLL
jgi:hypothetical protein